LDFNRIFAGMSNKKRVVFNWSGGKDSAFALHQLLTGGDLEIVSLLTSVNAAYDRVSMHGVRVDLLHQQAASIGIPLQLLRVPAEVTMDEYDGLMRSQMNEFKQAGINDVVFGDIFLEDLRRYREERLAEIQINAHFPLWKKDTGQLALDFMDTGFKAIIVCTDASLGESFAGRLFDRQFLADLPAQVDPCGENGEFHTFVFDGPIFENPVRFSVGEKVRREYKNSGNRDNSFWYCDLLPA
jgi:uncharacterized protein (TIGR00290 family)